MRLTQRFWQGKRVFLTGHTGFKGSWLCLLLNELGADVRGFAFAPAPGAALFADAKIGETIDSIVGDVRDFEALRSAMHAFRPDVVIHMAAQALVRPSYREPVSTYSTNVMGSVHVLEAVRTLGGVRAVVNVTSDKCYDNRENQWAFQETDPMGGHDPYSNSKGCAELVTDSYRKSFFSGAESRCAVGSGRAGNVIGGGDWAEDRLIPDIMRNCRLGRSIEIRSPNAIRPWQHVLEPLGGYLQLAESLYESGREFAEGWNFGPRDEDAIPVREIVDRVTRYWGDGATWHLTGSNHPHEANFLKLDCRKADARLGWTPRTNIDVALKWTVDWYKNFFEGADARTLTQRQIRDFLTTDKDQLCTRRPAAFAKAS